MMTIKSNTFIRLFVLLGMLASSQHGAAAVAFQDPSTAAWGGWSRGDASTSYVHWSQIDALTDHTPDAGNLGASYALLNANNAGAFITGGGAGGNVYSFADTPDFTMVLQPDYALPSEPVSVALQLKILGTDLDSSSVKLGGLAWDSTETLFSGSASGPFGGLEKEYLFVWNAISAQAAYQLDFLATGSSLSLDEASLDIGISSQTSPVPIPAAGWLFINSLAGLSILKKRKQKQ